MAELLPQTPLVPGAYDYANNRQRWTIPTIEERRGSYAGHVLACADWSQVRKSGDLLYVGSTVSLMTRLHPTNHAMWSLIEGHPIYERIRIAVWTMEVLEDSDIKDGSQ